VVWRLEKINRRLDVPNDARVNVTFNIAREQCAKSGDVEAQDDGTVIERTTIVPGWQRQVRLIRP
jgi:hypothetical protein